ncbi:MAG: TolC family protein [Hymenobacter sp.]|nr:MAG: TolC family protein [Hymenobacter sp.]
MKNYTLGVLLAATALAPLAPALAQTPASLPAPPLAGPMALSLSQAVRYAVANKPSLLSTRLAEQTAHAKVGEIKAQGLPQVNVAANVADNFKLQKSLIDAGAFGGGAGALNGTTLTQRDIAAAQAGQAVTLTPAYAPAVPVPPQAIAFGLQYAGNSSLSLSQQIFDGSYLIGLKASKVYEELSHKQTQQAEIDVVEQVSKAYYSTLVARSRLTLLARNVQRLDTVLYQTNQTFKAGFAEKLDVDRLRVQRNNLVVEQQKALRLTELSVALLKFQMGLPQAQPVQLTDSLGAAVVDASTLRRNLGSANFSTGGGVDGLGGVPSAPLNTPTGAPTSTPGLNNNNGQPVQAQAAFNYNNRIEFSTLQTQQALAGLDLRNRTAGAYPRLSFTAAYGFSGSARTVSDLFAFRGPNSVNSNGFVNQNWFGFGNVGLALNVPVFDGFRRRYQVQQARIAQQTIERGMETLRQSIDLQDTQSRTTLINALDVLDNQKANLDLAADVARVTRIKFNAGVGSNIEVITAETSLRESQTNYYAAIYDVLVAKVDRDKATGELYQQAK